MSKTTDSESKTCLNCRGSGRVMQQEVHGIQRKCPLCQGTGKTKSSRVFTRQ